jgi:hypothetical protein
MSRFKVMPWLRALRDRTAEEEKGLTVEQRLEKHRRESAPLVEQFVRNHPAARRIETVSPPMVAEKNATYRIRPAPNR